jgi:hypothetical protein
LFNSKGVDTSCDEGAPEDDDFVFCPPCPPAVVVVVVVAVRPESFRRAAFEDDINLFSKLSVSVFEEFSNFSFDASLSFLFVGKLRGARKREFQVLYPSQTTLSIYTR